MCYWQMLSLLIDTDVSRYGYIQLIHMYKQLYTTKNKTLAGGGRTIMFYATVLTYEYMNSRSYMIHMNIYSYVHMFTWDI